MHTAAFVEAYPRDHSQYARTVEAESADARLALGHAFGRVLHDKLSQRPRESSLVFTQNGIDAYSLWANTDHLRAYVDTMRSDEEATEEIRPSGFHVLNAPMLREWLVQPKNTRDRSKIITSIQDNLATCAAPLFVRREQLFLRELAGEAPHPNRPLIEGMLNELDAAMILLEIKRHHPQIDQVVPAPYQFEANKHRYNADFVVISGNQAIGIQVKSAIRRHHDTEYDSERIVLLDGKNHLGNALYKKFPGKSEKQRVGWAGIICAQRIHAVQTQGRNGLGHGRNGAFINRDVLRAKQAIRPLVADIKSEVKYAEDVVARQLLPRLEISV